jgi:AcrR family transcriptional regulator
MVASEALSEEKRDQILFGAACIFARDGYEGASMSRIAAEAKVSKGTLYNHFSGKAELFAAYVEEACLRGLTDIFAGVGDGDPAASLRIIGHRMVGLMLSPLGLTIYRMVVSEAQKFPELARIFYQAGPAIAIDTLATWLVRQNSAGRLAVPDPAFAAEQFFALCQTRFVLQRKLHLLNDPTPEELQLVVDASVRMFLASYAAPS